MRCNVIIYDAEDAPIFVVGGYEEVFTHDLPTLMPAGGTWRMGGDIRLVKQAPALADLPKPEGAPR